MPVNPAAALAIQVAKGILSMGWAFWSVDHVKQSHSGGPPPLTIKMSWPGVVNCQPECSQFGSIWDGLAEGPPVSAGGRPGVVFDCVIDLQAVAGPSGPAARLLGLLEAGWFTLYV